MRRRGLTEPIGLSTLDLFCGLFGLLVTLYAITERVDYDPGVAAAELSFVRAEVEGDAPIVIGVQVVVGAETAQSWPDCAARDVVFWGRCRPGLTEGKIDGDAPMTSIGVALLGHDDGVLIGSDPVKVFVTTKDDFFTCTLTLDKGFRGWIDMTGAEAHQECVKT